MTDIVQTTDNGGFYNSPAFQAELRATKDFDWEEAAAAIVARSLAFKERCARTILGHTSAALSA